MKSIQKDELAKKGWKNFFSIMYIIFWTLLTIRTLVRMRDKYKNTPSELHDYILWIAFSHLIFYGIMYFLYWIKPIWFRVKVDTAKSIEV